MATLRTGPEASQPPATLLDSVSPYGSRRLTVEYDGLTTAAYLHDESSVIAATWIANHARAPRTTDARRLGHGQAPLMPAARTKHPRGRPPLDAASLQALWFEEGDGVALLERGTLLAVIPGWSDMSRGMPGYCRDVVGQTPFGWSLDDALEGLGPRVQRARDYWQWRQSPTNWGQFQSTALTHLARQLGPGAHYWDAAQGQQPSVGLSERPPGPDRPYTVLSTVGMSAQRMPVVEQVIDDPTGYCRVELALATTIPSGTAALVFLWLAVYPWRAVTWFGPGHNVRWYDQATPFPLGAGYQGVLLLEDPSVLPGPEPPDLSGFTIDDDPVRWLWIIPITERDRQLAKERGSASLVRRLAVEGRTWITGLWVNVEVDAQEDEPPQEYCQDGAHEGAEPGEAHVAAIPGDYDADDEVDRQDEKPKPSSRHAILQTRENTWRSTPTKTREQTLAETGFVM